MSDQALLTRRETLLGASTVAATSAFGMELPISVGDTGERSTANSASPYTFERNFPTKDAAQRALDDADYQRAITAYRFWYPTVNNEGVFNGLRELGIADNQSVGIVAIQPRHMLFTPNSDTPYGFAVLDLKDGPMVAELPQEISSPSAWTTTRAGLATWDFPGRMLAGAAST